MKRLNFACYILLLTGLPHSQAKDAQIEARKIAEAAGLEAFDDVSRIAFTFNLKLPDREVSRSWDWNIAQSTVTNSDGVTYDPTAVGEAEKEMDSAFINDKYWLIFPFHLVWDSGTTITVEEEKIAAPISGELMHQLTIQYSEGGYTPGDAYDLLYDDDYVVREWIFRKGGAAEPSRITTWEGYVEHKGLQLATDHRGTDEFRIWFTDIKVE